MVGADSGSVRVARSEYSVRVSDLAMTVSSLVHWPLMGGLLHLVLVGSFGIHADYVYK